MKLKALFSILLTLSFMSSIQSQPKENLINWWSFDDAKEIEDSRYTREKLIYVTEESITGGNYYLKGLPRYVPGVSGTALKLDGFTSYVEGIPEGLFSDEEGSYKLPEALTVEAWVSIGAYPWNWAPIITIGKYGITGWYFGIDSRGRVGFYLSDGTAVWHGVESDLIPGRKVAMELKEWYHVAAAYNIEEGISLYIDGKLVGTYNNFDFDYGIAYSDIDEGFRIGMNKEMMAPTDPVREWATFPSQYSLDGIIDELKIYNEKLTSEEVEKLYTNITPENKPKFDDRKFPTIKKSGRFAADYTRLKFYPEWDALWPAGNFMDVVVQFDDFPFKVMFWRGTRYSPCWVSENNIWMADQSRETLANWYLSEGDRNEITTGCVEHMSDAQCRSSRVDVIESHDARIVVNWRYMQMDVKFRPNELENNTGFGEWGNEEYYIYPDGVAVRNVLPGRGHWSEAIVLNQPGTTPDDNLYPEAATLVNMKGETKNYSWEGGYPTYDLEGGIIQVVNLQSEYKPFQILNTGSRFQVFAIEVRPEYSNFPWWNHWPVAQVISDGRYAYAPDRTSHSSLSWGRANTDYALYGMTNKDPKELIPLAKSWNHPPKLVIEDDDFISKGYNQKQRAYIIQSKDNSEVLKFSLKGSAESPVYNPAFVIKDWGGEDTALKINGENITEGKKFRYGFEYDAEGNYQLVVWIEKQSETELKVELSKVK